MIIIIRLISSLTSFKLDTQNLTKKAKYHHFAYLRAIPTTYFYLLGKNLILQALQLWRLPHFAT